MLIIIYPKGFSILVLSMYIRKMFFLIVFFALFSGVMYCQVDNSERKVTINFGALPIKKAPELPETAPADYKIRNKDFKVNSPKINFPQRSMSLSPKAKNGFQYKSTLDLEHFGRRKPKSVAINAENSVKRYPSQNEKILNKIKEGGFVKHFPDIDLGSFQTNSDKAYIRFRDSGRAVDGDAIRIVLNNKIVVNEIVLTRFLEVYEINLVDGFNRIEIETVSEGTLKPNTMHLIIQDGNLVLFRDKDYSLSRGSSSNILIFKI